MVHPTSEISSAFFERAMTNSYGDCFPSRFDRAIISMTSRLPNNWIGLRVAIGLRRAVTMRLPAGAGLDVEHWNVRMRLHPHHNICEKLALFTPQMLDPSERAELGREIASALESRRRFSFVDIGAHVGIYSLFVAAAAGYSADIIAVEPEPVSLARLRFNVAANPRAKISIQPIALSDQSGTVALEINRDNRGGTKTRPATDADANVVPCMSLRDLLSIERTERIDALKIDVEGNEDKILMPFFRDAPQSLWPGLVIIEDWNSKVIGEMQSRGYEIVMRIKANFVLRFGPQHGR